MMEHAPEPAPKMLRITGLPAVTALFERNGRLVERLFFDDRNADAVAGFCRQLAKARKPYRQVDAEELARVAGTVLHGGVVAVTGLRPIPAFDPAEAKRWAAEGKPLLVLDGIGNPHNLGAIVRTAAFFGLDRIVISDHPAQAGPSEASYRVAEGGMEHVRLYRATGLPKVLQQLKVSYRVLGTALGKGEQLDRLFRWPSRRDRPRQRGRGSGDRDPQCLRGGRTLAGYGPRPVAQRRRHGGHSHPRTDPARPAATCPQMPFDMPHWNPAS